MPVMIKIKDISLIGDEHLGGWLNERGYDFDVEAFREWVMYHGKDYIAYALVSFEDAYRGQWNSIEDFAHEQLMDYDDVYQQAGEGCRGWTTRIDTIAWECDYYISDTGHVFDRNV